MGYTDFSKMFTREQCLARAEKLRDMARRAHSDDHAVWLQTMADIWERMAADFKPASALLR